MVKEFDSHHNNALLIEDDGDDRLKIRLLLEVMGFTVYEAPSPIQARELFALRDYSLAVIHIGHAPLAVLRCAAGFEQNQQFLFLCLPSAAK